MDVAPSLCEAAAQWLPVVAAPSLREEAADATMPLRKEPTEVS